MSKLKLSPADLHEARRLKRNGWSRKRLAARYGVSLEALDQRLYNPIAVKPRQCQATDFEPMWNRLMGIWEKRGKVAPRPKKARRAIEPNDLEPGRFARFKGKTGARR